MAGNNGPASDEWQIDDFLPLDQWPAMILTSNIDRDQDIVETLYANNPDRNSRPVPVFEAMCELRRREIAALQNETK